MLKALADIHVKHAIVSGLRLRGMDVTTAQEVGLDAQPDDVLLQVAADAHRILLTNDSDLLRIDAEWAAIHRDHSGIIYWPQQGRKTGDVIQRILSISVNMPADRIANHVTFI